MYLHTNLQGQEHIFKMSGPASQCLVTDAEGCDGAHVQFHIGLEHHCYDDCPNKPLHLQRAGMWWCGYSRRTYDAMDCQGSHAREAPTSLGQEDMKETEWSCNIAKAAARWWFSFGDISVCAMASGLPACKTLVLSMCLSSNDFTSRTNQLDFICFTVTFTRKSFVTPG